MTKSQYLNPKQIRMIKNSKLQTKNASGFKFNFRNKNIHIVGSSGIEGAAIIKLLQKWKFTNVTTHDFMARQEWKRNFHFFHNALTKSEQEDLFEVLNRFPKKICLKDDYLKNIMEAEAIFVPQSWYKYKFNYPSLSDAQKAKIPFFNMTGLYLSLFKGTIIGVTGSNGKTTTANLIYEIFKKAKKEVYLVGNDRKNKQVLDKIEQLPATAFLIMEISNRQLKMPLPRTPAYSIITNIYPNHLDEHKNFADYVATKRKIIGLETKVAILNYDNEETRKTGEEIQKSKVKSQNLKVKINNAQFKTIAERVVFFSRKEELKEGISLTQKPKILISKSKINSNNKIQNIKQIVYTKNGKKTGICDLRDIKLQGEHNVENVLAATAMALLFKIKPEIITEVLRTFGGMRGRMEEIATINGIKFISDLKSTTPTATYYAVKSLEKPLTLMVGGNEKNLDYRDLNKTIEERVDTLILLPGTVNRKIITPSARGKKVNIIKTESLEEAIGKAKKVTPKGGTVLISPAGEAFYTMFLDKRKGKKDLKEVVGGRL